MGSSRCCILRSCQFFPYSIPVPRRNLNFSSNRPPQSLVSASNHILSGNFTWDDVVHISETQQQHDSSDLRGFFDKVTLCNRNSVIFFTFCNLLICCTRKAHTIILLLCGRTYAFCDLSSFYLRDTFQEKQCEFIPFLIDAQVVGYVHNGFAHHLKRYKDVFTFPDDPRYSSNFGFHVALHPLLSAPEDRTEAVGHVVKRLGEELIPGIRNELYPVTSSFGEPEFFSLERAAAPYFGIKAYGVHMNGYVEKDNQKYLWIGKRSKVKSTYPGKLDHLVAGGLPNGISCGENVMKECEEEAGIPRSLSSKAKPVGAVSYLDINGFRLKRDVLFCYDLKFPEDFVPANEDGEVESFKLLPVTHVANIIRSTRLFKDNCNIVIIDFLFRHGYIKPEWLGYLKLLQSLRSGDCT